MSFALVVTLGSGAGVAVQKPKTAKADVSGNASGTFVTSSDSDYATQRVQEAQDGTWKSGCYVASTSKTLTNVVIQGTVFLEIRKGVTLTCVGTNGSGRTTPGKPGIELTSGNTLIVLGEGTLVARGGNAANGANGSNGSSSSVSDPYVYSGAGGDGGAGGAGAGAGIGTRGGNGGSGGSGGSGRSRKCHRDQDGRSTGGNGSSGYSGSNATTSMGALYALGSVTITAQGGTGGYGGAGGSLNTIQSHIKKDQGIWYHDRHGYSVGGAGGGGGGGGTGAAGIGIGGGGGAGGAGGGAGGIYVKDDGSFNNWSSLKGSGGVGGTGARSGSRGDGYSGTYGGSGGSSSGYTGSSTGSTQTVWRNNLAAVTSKSNGGKTAGISSRTKLTYNQSIQIQMLDNKTGVVSTDGWNNIKTYSKNTTTYSKVKLGYDKFDLITDVTNTELHKPGYTFEGWYSGAGEDARLVVDATGKVVQNVTNYTCDGVYNSVSSPLYAHWKRKRYKLTFDSNGGGFTGNRKTVTKESFTGETLEDLTTDQSPTRTGYFLLGYNTEKDGSGEWIYGSNDNKTRDKGETVKKLWNVILAERENESEEHLKDDQVIHQKDTSAATFINTWDTDKTIDTAGKDNKLSAYLTGKLEGIYPYEEDTTIYAQWAPIHYTLRYFSEDSSNEAQWLGDEYNVPYFNVAYKELEEFGTKRNHYEFKGWNIYASQDWGMYEPKRLYRTSLTEQDGEIVSLYAAWQMTDSYTIFYNGNGGAGTPVNGYTFKDSKETDEDTYEISSKVPTRPNYSFLGWNEEIDGSGKEWKAGDKVPGGIGGNLTLYAQWKLNPSITYHANGGSFSITPEKQFVSSGTKFQTLSGDSLPTREGYHFVTWSLSPTDAATTYDAGADVIMPDNNLVLYAVWEKEGYGVSSTAFNDNPDEQSNVMEYYSLELEEKKDDQKIYVPFARNVVPGEGTYAGKEMSIDYTAKTSSGSDYKVKYKEDFTFRIKIPKYVNASSMMVYANGAVLLAKKKETVNGNTLYYYTITNAMQAQDITVTGLTYQTYKLEFHANEGTIEDKDQLTGYTYGTKTVLPIPERTGYRFRGWYTDSDFTGTAVSEIAADDTGDMTFYACWEANRYKIVFDGTVYEDSETATADGGVTKDRKTTYTQDNIVYDQSTPIIANEFYYHMDVQRYTADGSSLDPASYDADKAGEQVIFLGWSTIKGAEKPMFIAGSRVWNLCTGETGDDSITLYPVYKTSNYKLTYNANGGKISREVNTIKKDADGNPILAEGNPEVETSTQEVISYTNEYQKCKDVTLDFAEIPVRKGYTFLGWTKTPVVNGAAATVPEYYSNSTYPEGSGENKVLSGNDFDKDTVLYAVWKENTYTITFDVNGGSRHVAQSDEAADPDHSKHDDAEKFKQTAAYSQTVHLTQDADENALFAVKSGGGGADEFLSAADPEEGINAFTGMYKVNQENPSKFEYFLGWSRTASATEPDYLQTDRIRKLAAETPEDTDVTLYAVWSDTPAEYAMFNACGGEYVPMTDTPEVYSVVRSKVAGPESGICEVPAGLLPETETADVTVTLKNGTSCEKDTEDSTTFILQRTGYHFAGWTTDISLKGTELEADMAATKQLLKAGLDPKNYTSQTYYAVWEPETTLITYHGNGAAEEDYRQKAAFDTVTKLERAKFTRTGYHFVRWAADIYNGDPVNDIGYEEEAQIYLDAADSKQYKNGLDLYAVWEQNPSHTLVYDTNGGYGGPENEDFVEGVEGRIYITEQYGSGENAGQISVDMPKRDGYTFLGWSSDSNADEPDEGYSYVKSTSPEESAAVTCPTWISKAGDNDRILYAVWKEIPKNEVNYLIDNEDSSAVFKSGSYSEGDQFGLYFDRTPSKEGYDFVGWSESKDGDDVYCSQDGRKYTMPAKEVIFYPVWHEHKYKITYKTANDDTIDCTIRNIAYSDEYKLATLEDIDESYAEAFAAKPGYQFTGWSTTPGGKVDYEPGQTVQALSAVEDAEIILYAVYAPMQTVYTLVNNYKVSEVDENLEDTTEGSTLDPINMGDNMPSLTEIPEKYGYRFGGYFTEKNGNGEMYYSADLTTVSKHVVNQSVEDVTLYAYWIPDQYTLYYECNGEKVGSQDVYYGENITTLSQENFSGMNLDDDIVLVGWKMDRESDHVDFNVKGSQISICTHTGFYKDGRNIILYAHTGKAAKSIVTYNPNGGNNEPVDDNKYMAGDVVQVNFDKTPKKSGYTFLGWALSSTASKPMYYQTEDNADLDAKTSFVISNDITLYAVWKANNYTVTYHRNYETEQTESAKVESAEVESADIESSSVEDALGYETEGYLLRGQNTFRRKGYSLAGWAITPETGVTYTPGQILTSPLTAVDNGNVDLYAVWNANDYNVIYDANKPEQSEEEVSGTMKETKMHYDEEGTLRANSYKLSGYKFMGWSTTPNGAVEYKNSAEVKNLSDKEDVVLYAVWKNRADLTEEDEDIDWSQKTLTAILSNTYALTVLEGQKPNLDNLIITAVYSDGTCRVVKNYQSNVDDFDTSKDTDIEIEYREGDIRKILLIPVRVKAVPSPVPSATPSAAPTVTPSATPTVTPSATPTATPSTAPSATPSATPTVTPSATPTVTPSATPTATPSAEPSATPSTEPSVTPSAVPSATPSTEPSATPSAEPSATPSTEPSATPGVEPSMTPSAVPGVTPENLFEEDPEMAQYPSLEEVENAIRATDTDKQDLLGSKYAKLQVKAAAKAKKTVKLSWKRVKGASGYIIYGGKYGTKMKKIKTVKAGTKKKYSYTVKKLKAKKYYKYLVVACKSSVTAKDITAGRKNVKVTKDKAITISKIVYVTSKHRKYGNPSKLRLKTSLKLKKGRKKKLKIKIYNTRRKVKKCGSKLRYEVANPKIVKVYKNGKVKALKKGKTYIYLYAQNGISKKVKIVVRKK